MVSTSFRRNTTWLVVAAAFAVASVPALAQAEPPAPAHEPEGAFPMSAADFRQHVSQRLEHARARMEERIARDQIPADKATEMRTRFQSAIAQIDTRVDEVCSDGTVTKEEALTVHDLSRSLLHHDKRHD
jgi:hypothetical protein